MTLEQIITKEKEHRFEDGLFGLNECKKSVKFDAKYSHKSLYTLLGEYVERANNDAFFNMTMILACWELINEQEEANEEYIIEYAIGDLIHRNVFFNLEKANKFYEEMKDCRYCRMWKTK